MFKLFVTDFECKYRNSFVTFQIFEKIVHEMVGLMYELCFAIWTMAVLSQKLVWLTTHRMFAFWAYIITLELASQFETFLGYFRRVYISFEN